MMIAPVTFVVLAVVVFANLHVGACIRARLDWPQVHSYVGNTIAADPNLGPSFDWDNDWSLGIPTNWQMILSFTAIDPNADQSNNRATSLYNAIVQVMKNYCGATWSATGGNNVVQADATCQAPSPSASATPSATPSTSATPSPSPSPSPSASASATPSATPSISATPSPSASLSATPSISTTPLPTPSRPPKLVAASDVTAEFALTQATFNMSAAFPLGAGGGEALPKGATQVVSGFSALQLGNLSDPTTSLSDFAGTLINGSDGAATYLYSGYVGNDTRLDQVYAFHEHDAEYKFAGVDFGVGGNSVKWSINLTASSSSPDGSSLAPPSHTTQWSVMRYRLAGLLTSSTAGSPLAVATNEKIIRRPGTPKSGMTTYYVPLFKLSPTSNAVAEVVLFDVALVDGRAAGIRHDIVAVNTAADTTTVLEYAVVLEFPPFETSLYYDPSLGLGVLLGSGSESSSGGDGNTGLIIGVAVAVPSAIVVVVAVVTAGVGIAWWQRRARVNRRSSVNFNADTLDDDL